MTATACPAAELEFYKDVYPFLKANCISCHNKTTTKADLNMETPELMKQGGESGPALIVGKSAESLVVLASLHQQDMEMPPANNKSGAVDLTPAEIALLKQWIDQGAKATMQQERTVTWQPLSAGVHPIYSVAVTRDGRYAACGRSNQIFIYDLATRQFVTRIGDPAEAAGGAHRALVQTLAFSPDGTRLASGSFREVKIWKLEPAGEGNGAPSASSTPVSTELIKKITAAAKVTVVSHAQSSDGKLAVTGCDDGSVRLWETTTAKPGLALRGTMTLNRQRAELDWTIARQNLEQTFQKAEVTRVETQNKAMEELLKKANEAMVAMNKALPEKQKAVKPAEEARVAAQKAVDDVSALIAKAPEGKADAALARQLKDSQDKLITAKTAENSVLAAASATESNVKDAADDVQRITETKVKNATLLAAANAALESAKKAMEKAGMDLAAARLAVENGTAKPMAVMFSDDSQQVAAAFDDGALRVWAVATGTMIEENACAKEPTVTLSVDGRGSFVSSKTFSVRTGPAPRWVLERTLGGTRDRGVFADRVNAVRFSPDGKTLATGGGELSRSGDVILFDVANGNQTKAFKSLHEDAVLGLDFSPDGRLLATGAADKIAKVTDITSGKQVNLFEGHTHHVMGVTFRADGRMLATAGADGVVLCWDMILGERKRKVEGWTKEVTSLQYMGATNQIVTSAGDNIVRIISDDGAVSRSISNLPDYMQAAASVPGASTIIAGGEDSFLRIWDSTTSAELASFGPEPAKTGAAAVVK